MGASPGRGDTARAQAQLRDTFVFTGACVMPQPELLIGAARHRFDADGNVIEPELLSAIGELVRALGAWTYRLGAREEAA
jgi:chromate reductase